MKHTKDYEQSPNEMHAHQLHLNSGRCVRMASFRATAQRSGGGWRVGNKRKTMRGRHTNGVTARTHWLHDNQRLPQEIKAWDQASLRSPSAQNLVNMCILTAHVRGHACDFMRLLRVCGLALWHTTCVIRLLFPCRLLVQFLIVMSTPSARIHATPTSW